VQHAAALNARAGVDEVGHGASLAHRVTGVLVVLLNDLGSRDDVECNEVAKLGHFGLKIRKRRRRLAECIELSAERLSRKLHERVTFGDLRCDRCEERFRRCFAGLGNDGLHLVVLDCVVVDVVFLPAGLHHARKALAEPHHG